MDFLGIIVMVLVLGYKLLNKLGSASGPSGPDGQPQRPRRLPSWLSDLEDAIPPVIKGSVEKRRAILVSQVPGSDEQPAETWSAKIQPAEAKSAETLMGPPMEAFTPSAEIMQPVAAAAENSAGQGQSSMFNELVPNDIIKGLVWAEILSPPRAKRPLTADSLRR